MMTSEPEHHARLKRQQQETSAERDDLFWQPPLKRRKTEADWSWLDKALAWAAITWVVILIFFIL